MSSSIPSLHVHARLSGLVRLLVAGLLACTAACGLVQRTPVEPVVPEASLALAQARTLLRSDEPGARTEAADFARRAAAAAPDWVAPLRVLDDLAREDLLTSDALARHVSVLEETDDRNEAARRMYLIGRLEGVDGSQRFQQAQRIAPDFAWAHHGAAWMRFTTGDAASAIVDGRRALALARDAWERSYFAIAQARYLSADGRGTEALALITNDVPAGGLSDVDRATLEVFRAELELAQDDEAVRERGLQRALNWLEDPRLETDEVVRLTAALRAHGARRGGRENDALELALAAREDDASRRLRAELLLERGAPGLARALSTDVGASNPSWRAAALAIGDVDVIERWLEALPAPACDEDGLPLERTLRDVVEAAREVSRAASAEAHAALGAALLTAGWFTEARGEAQALARFDAAAGLALDERAARGLALVRGLGRVLDRVDAGAAVAGSASIDVAAEDEDREAEEADGTEVRSIRSLDELLAAVQLLFDRYGETEAGSIALGASPIVRFGPFASVVHPGPRFSARDARQELGQEGDAVPGLANAFASIGRFALFGQVVGGGGPDATVLRRLAVEEKRGEHLGVPFRGTVVWCEGSDVPSRPARFGAPIYGAALHEGYWIDVDGIRGGLARWRALERAFFEDAARPDRATVALEAVGPALRGVGPPASERIRPYAAGGESDRVRLAVLRDRRAERGTAQGDAPTEPSLVLEELLEVTAVHEEGHLCDRERFLPLAKNWLGVAGFLLRARLSPQRVAELVEYRAQLVALCVTSDPRMPLADCLDALAGGSTTPHGAAYRRLVQDLLEELERNLDAYPQLDPEHYLVHQWHRLGPEDVRAVALALAGRVGVDGR